MAKTLHNLYSSPKERDNYSNHKSFFSTNCKLWTKRKRQTLLSSFISNKKIFFDMGNYHLWLSAEGEWEKKNHLVLIPEKKKKPFFRNCHECSLISMNFSHFWSFPGCLWGQGNEWEEIPLHFHGTSILSLKMRFYRQFLTKSSFIVFLSLQRKTKQPPWPKKTPKCIYIYIQQSLLHVDSTFNSTVNKGII